MPGKRRDSDIVFHRYDRGVAPVRELGKSHQTKEGYLFAEGVFAKEGVLEYRDSSGNVVRELVPAMRSIFSGGISAISGKRPSMSAIARCVVASSWW